jgi:hypothetical protein
MRFNRSFSTVTLRAMSHILETSLFNTQEAKPMPIMLYKNYRVDCEQWRTGE